MNHTFPYIITVSRMLGSGGLFIGRCLAEELGIAYFDREILARAAVKLGLQEADLAEHDEKKTSLWDLFLKSGILENPELYTEPRHCLPSDRQLFEAEGEIIRNLAAERSAVIIGRGGAYLLKDHPRHLSVFLHCDAELRIKRISELYHLTEKEAEKVIRQSDTGRGQHYRSVTGREWTDARQYSICIDTGKISLDDSVAMIRDHVNKKFL